MKTRFRIIQILMVVLAAFFLQAAVAQTGVLDPNDPIVVYDANNPPTTPRSGTLVKWVKTNRLSWNTSSYKCYFYKGIAFRLKFPKTYQHNVNDGKTYPLFVFFHGKGEKGTIYDNEYQLYHGGELHKNAVDNGRFDGFLLYTQIQTDTWGSAPYSVIKEIIDKYLVPQVKVDPYRVMVDGLSAGGSAAWSFTITYPKTVAASLPISAASTSYIASADKVKFIPIWHFQGGLDQAPTPYTSERVGGAILNVGGNYRYTKFPTQGHGCWYSAWAEPDYFPYMMRASKLNPWPLFGRTEFCPNDTVSVTIGVTAGFDGYEWRKDGQTIPDATFNTYSVTELGTYDCRIKSGTVWSGYSPVPVVIKLKAATISPNIQISGLASKVIPVPDGNAGVKLEVPDGYTSYVWQRDGLDSTLSTTRYYTPTIPGNYKVKITEQYGCFSDFSPLFKVIDANGTNKPDAANNVLATTVSKTSIRLDWNQNSNPAFNETNFEIYQAGTAAGPYKLIAITNADVSNYLALNLNAGATYFFKIRAVNDFSASSLTNPVSATTNVDATPPSAPLLRKGAVTRNSVQLTWDASADDVGVTYYDIYINGVKSYITSNTSFTVYNLTANKTYNFTVRARDLAGNISLPSNQVTATVYLKGLTYKYYQGDWNSLPDFNTLTPALTGVTANVTIDSRLEENDFGYLWEGTIKIPVAGTYTFRTNSDDGSKLYIGSLNSTSPVYNFSATPVVNNDGLHGSQNRDGTITLAAGFYPVAVTFFEKGGGQNISVYWNTPQTNNNFTLVPDSVFTDNVVISGVPPSAPSNLTATAVSFKKINLSWTDNSNNETAFEIYRSLNANGPFSHVGSAGAGSTTFTDSSASASTTYYYRIKAIGKYGESDFNDDNTSLKYSYYETIPYSALPDFNTLTPKRTGYTNNFRIDIGDAEDNFAFKFDGVIIVPSNGTYTFYTASDDGSKLYIDGTTESSLVVNNDGLHGTTERSGSKSLTAGIHPIRVTFFERGGGQTLFVSYQGPGISKQLIPDAALHVPPVSATTPPSSGAPAPPANLVVSSTSSSINNLNFYDNSNSETNFEIYRSINNSNNYLLIKTTGANITNLLDSNLTANTVYYYKIRAINENGASPYSNEAFDTTLNNAPTISAITNISMRYGTQLQVNVNSFDPDGEQLNIVITNSPAFSNYVSTGNGTGILTFNPQQADQSVYNDIIINVSDEHGGTNSTTFSLTVNDNYDPVITGASDITVAEGTNGNVILSATDQNENDVLTWDIQGLPSFITKTINGNSTMLQIAPGFADNDTYTITAVINDDKGGSDSRTFIVTVTDENPNKRMYVNFNGTSATNEASPWNNSNGAPTAGKTLSNLLDDEGNTTNVSLTLVEKWANYAEVGYVTGNNSGIYPDNVMKSSYYETANSTRHIRINGLSTTDKYNLTFFASRAGVTDNRTTNYSAGGQTVSLNASGNQSNTVKISNISSDNNSQIEITIARGTGSLWEYINSLVIGKVYDDLSSPATPKDFQAYVENGIAKLTWRDVAYNEDAYEVYRSANINGPFIQLNQDANSKDTNGYNDSSVSANTTYFYKVRAVNTYGASNYTNTIQTIVPNKAPVLSDIANQNAGINQITTVNINATDDLGDVITLSVSGLPSFATFTNNGNGNGTIRIQPNNTQAGTYNNIIVNATDNNGANSSKTFNLIVSDPSINTVYINFNQTSPAEFPWNNMNVSPTVAGKSLSNLKDDPGNNTGVSITLPEAWSGVSATGATTGDNSGIYPDNVMVSNYYYNSTSSRHIRLNGLDNTKKYTLVIFASRAGVSDNRTTVYTVGTQSVSLNASGNINKTVTLSGLSPDVNNQIEITLTRGNGSVWVYINSLVLQSYVESNIPNAPANLKAEAKAKDKILLTWNDNSSNETGFEIWRSTRENGTYTLLDTVSSNVNTYINNGLASGSVFFYKVRAKTITDYSVFSNIAGGASYSYVINVNFNTDNPQTSPWNNTSALPYEGFALNNLINDANQFTGVNMTLVHNFTGTNPNGVNTRTNSGVYPDNVIRSSWYVDHGDTAIVKIDGLSGTMFYNFTFFGSRSGSGNRTTFYQINNQAVSLNCSNNTLNTVKINNVTPDDAGAVYIKVYIPDAVIYGYLGALVIEGYSSTDSTVVNSLFSRRNTNRSNIFDDVSGAKDKIEAYPNPFTDDIILKLNIKNNVSKFTVVVTDISGRIIHSHQFDNVAKGLWQQRIGLNGQSLKSGIYIVKVLGMPGEKPKIVKVMK